MPRKGSTYAARNKRATADRYGEYREGRLITQERINGKIIADQLPSYRGARHA